MLRAVCEIVFIFAICSYRDCIYLCDLLGFVVVFWSANIETHPYWFPYLLEERWAVSYIVLLRWRVENIVAFWKTWRPLHADISPLPTLNLPESLLWNPIFEYASSNALRPWRLWPIDSTFECVEFLNLYWSWKYIESICVEYMLCIVHWRWRIWAFCF